MIPLPVCSDTPTSLEFATNDHLTTTMYIEGSEITYTCTHNTTIMQTVSCQGTGDWETPTIECPSECDDVPVDLEFATNDHLTTTMYIEGSEITYTCTHNTTIMQTVSCDGTGNWESPTIQCPSSEFQNLIF